MKEKLWTHFVWIKIEMVPLKCMSLMGMWEHDAWTLLTKYKCKQV